MVLILSSRSVNSHLSFFYLLLMTGEYVLLDKADTVQPSTSGGESEPSEPSEEEDKSSPEKPLDSSEDSLALDKVFGFVDYDEVSVSLDGLFFLSFKMTILIFFFFFGW